MATMDLNALRLFVEVAESLGFSKAAKRLGLPRSSISRGISALERDLNVQLFSRSTRKVALTRAGEALYASVAGQLTTISSALDRLSEGENTASGQVKLTVPHDLAADILPRALTGFVRRYPGVKVDVRVTNRVVDLIGEGFDAALRPGPRQLRDSSLRARRLTDATAGLFAAPGYLARLGAPKTLQEARQHDWVVGPIPPHNAVAPKRPPIITCDDILFARAALREGLGIGLLPNFVAAQDVISGDLVRLLPNESVGRFSLFFVTPPLRQEPPKLRVLRDYLVEYFRAQPLSPVE